MQPQAQRPTPAGRKRYVAKPCIHYEWRRGECRAAALHRGGQRGPELEGLGAAHTATALVGTDVLCAVRRQQSAPWGAAHGALLRIHVQRQEGAARGQGNQRGAIARSALAPPFSKEAAPPHLHSAAQLHGEDLHQHLASGAHGVGHAARGGVVAHAQAPELLRCLRSGARRSRGGRV